MIKRTKEALDDIVHSYEDKSTIVCVTSGVNLTGFICYFYNIEQTKDIVWAKAISTSPVRFTSGSWDF